MRRQWSSQSPLRQFKGIPAEMLTRIEKKDLAWERWGGAWLVLGRGWGRGAS
jgi:hypothetical protein